MTNQLIHQILIILGSLFTTFAVRNFELIVIDVKCTANTIYMYNMSCSINNSQPKNVRLNVYGALRREIRDCRLELSIDLIRNNGDKVTFFKVKDVDFCSFLQANVTLPMMKMYKDMMRKYGNWPNNCPLLLGYLYSFKNMTLDANYLPTFVPNSDFIVNIGLLDSKLRFWELKMHGKVSHKRKNKGKMGRISD